MKFLKLTLYFLLPVLSFVIWYLLVAFVMYELNPESMGEGSRYFIVCLGLMTSVASIMVAHGINKN